MNKWFYVVDLRQLWFSYVTGTVNINDVKEELVRRLYKLPPYEYDPLLQYHVSKLKRVKNPLQFIHAFNPLMDWASQIVKEDDQEVLRLCWIRLLN